MHELTEIRSPLDNLQEISRQIQASPQLGVKLFIELAVCRATAASHPKHAGAWRLLTASLGLMGRIDEAREALVHARTLQADLSNDEVYSDPADRARVLEGLRKAGLNG
jgi:hypothetical protein